MKSTPFIQTILKARIIILILSLLINPVLLVSAQSGDEGTQGVTHYSYLPITVGGEKAYYVSTAGKDTNPGTLKLPWRTIGKAASMVQPGDTVYIRAGIYNEAVHFHTSGTEQDPIRILAYPGEIPIMDGGNTIPEVGGSILRIIGDYIHASGLEIRNSAYEGIRIQGNYDIVSSMFVHHCQSSGIVIIQGHNSIAEYNRVWRNSLVNEYGVHNWGAGITALREGVSYATIRHNQVWENWGEGISTGSADHTVIEDNIIHDSFSANIYISSSTNVLCQRNFLYTDPSSYVFPYGDHGGLMMGDESYDPPTANITVINNISIGNHGNFWWWQGVQGGGMSNVLIANNTFINGIGDPHRGEGGVIISVGEHQNVRFENNIVQQDGDLPVIMTHAQPGVTYSHNLWSKPPYTAASGPGDIIGNPLFAQIGNPYQPLWYTLTGVSPAIDNGISLSEVAVDYFGLHREAPPDMGANEFFPTP